MVGTQGRDPAGDLRLQELMNERVQLRKKNTKAEAEVKKLEEGI